VSRTSQVWSTTKLTADTVHSRRKEYHSDKHSTTEKSGEMARGRWSFRQWSREMTLATVASILMLLFLNIRRDVVISKSVHQQLKQRHRFDEDKIITNSNYAVCNRLTALQEDMLVEQMSRTEFEDVYKSLVDSGNIVCGIEKVYTGLLGSFGLGSP
jgi:hypothetical protein